MTKVEIPGVGSGKGVNMSHDSHITLKLRLLPQQYSTYERRLEMRTHYWPPRSWRRSRLMNRWMGLCIVQTAATGPIKHQRGNAAPMGSCPVRSRFSRTCHTCNAVCTGAATRGAVMHHSLTHSTATHTTAGAPANGYDSAGLCFRSIPVTGTHRKMAAGNSRHKTNMQWTQPHGTGALAPRMESSPFTGIGIFPENT